MSSCSATLASARAVASATLVALTLTALPAGRIAGAVYSPLPEIVPAVAFPPGTPLTAHVTPMFELPVTVAANCCVCPRNSVALPGWIVTVIAGGGGGGADPRPLVPVHPVIAKIAGSAASASRTRTPRRSGPPPLRLVHRARLRSRLSLWLRVSMRESRTQAVCHYGAVLNYSPLRVASAKFPDRRFL